MSEHLSIPSMIISAAYSCNAWSPWLSAINDGINKHAVFMNGKDSLVPFGENNLSVFSAR
jgi:hypothetical protein